MATKLLVLIELADDVDQNEDDGNVRYVPGETERLIEQALVNALLNGSPSPGYERIDVEGIDGATREDILVEVLDTPTEDEQIKLGLRLGEAIRKRRQQREERNA